MFIYPYRMGSKSVAALKSTLGARVIRLEGSQFRGSKDKLVINWGNSNLNEEVEKCTVLNSPAKIKTVSNKRTFFEAVADKVRVPEFTTDKDKAKEWADNGCTVVVREKLTGHSGEGIVILEDPLAFEEYNHNKARLYVKYIPKKQEYRIHIVNGEVVLMQRKARNMDVPDQLVNWKVRSHANGFVFAKNESHTPPEDVYTQAKLAMEACELDFGAVDVVWNEHKQQAYVLEINTAPGLEGTTADTYMDALKNLAALYQDIANAQDSAARRPRRRKGGVYMAQASLGGQDQPAPAPYWELNELE